MSGNYQKLTWQEEKNGFVIDCLLDVAIHSSDSSVILLIIPGVDGSVDGYENKYVQIAEGVQVKNKAAVVRISNPFISSFHWESNIRKVLEFIQDNANSICQHDDFELRIMAHSAGAAVVACIAWEYPFISKLLLINPAMKLGSDNIASGLKKFGVEKVKILVGSKDPSFEQINSLKLLDGLGELDVIEINGADHYFSGDSFQAFLSAANDYLF